MGVSLPHLNSIAKMEPNSIPKCASWAIWYDPPVGGRNSALIPPEYLPSRFMLPRFRKMMKPHIVFLGLNRSSGTGVSTSNWHNYHSNREKMRSLEASCGDQLLAETITRLEPLLGAYMTDYIHPPVHGNSKKVLKDYHQQSGTQFRDDLFTQLNAIQSKPSNTTVICFGWDVYKMLRKDIGVENILNSAQFPHPAMVGFSALQGTRGLRVIKVDHFSKKNRKCKDLMEELMLLAKMLNSKHELAELLPVNR
jgi:hypothetical protein